MSTEETLHLDPAASEAEILAAIEALKLNVPRLAEAELVRAAFNHYNLSQKKGTRLAEAIVQDLIDEDKRRTWIEQRCIELLRARIAIIHPQLTDLARETTSRRIKSAIIAKIYSAIAAGYSQLADAAAEVCARKQLAIPPEPPDQKIQGVQVDLNMDKELPSVTSRSDEDAQASPLLTDAESELTQIANTQYFALVVLNEYLFPLCEARGIKLDPQLQIALLQNMLLQAYAQGTHRKITSTKTQ